jgi:hypothetical protein
MAYIKEILTGAGALGCAIGIGYVMQSSEPSAQRLTADVPQAEMKTVAAAETSDVLLDVQEITLTSAEFDSSIALPDTDVEVVKALAPASVLDTPELPNIAIAPASPAPTCDIIANARPVAAAMVNLEMEAPCLPNERVTVHHNGMIFTESTSETGSLNLTLPALAHQAVFILAFTNGDGAVAQTQVDDINEYSRAVLQWKGNTGFQIHAREFGAGYGDVGHLWMDAPGTVADAVVGSSGVLTRHGDIDAADPLLAEVYTFPKAATARAGNIALSVETEVTDMNCGIEIEAQSLELQGDSTIKTSNLTLAVPDCDAKDSFLVLNNLLQDLKVAVK